MKKNNLNILPVGTILYTCIASIGKISISTKPCISNQQINSIVVHSEYNNEFIFYALSNITEYIKSTQSTTTLPIINKSEFSKFKISLPCLVEQTKIADFLSAIDKDIDLHKQKLEQTKLYKKALLQQLLV